MVILYFLYMLEKVRFKTIYYFPTQLCIYAKKKKKEKKKEKKKKK